MEFQRVDRLRALQIAHPQYACYQQNADFTLTCTICNKIIQFKDKQSLDKHLKTQFHCTFSKLHLPLSNIQASISKVEGNTEELLKGMKALSAAPLQFPYTVEPLPLQLSEEIEENVQISTSSQPLEHQQKVLPTKQKLWFDEVKAIYGGKKTEKEYTRYNLNFQKWHTAEYGSKSEIEESHMRRYVQQFKGKDTKMLVAALKFRFSFCERRDFDFKRLIKTSDKRKPHRVLSPSELQELDEKCKGYPLMRIGCKVLFDLAARVQDLLQFKFNSFESDETCGGIYNWTTKKTGEQRFGYLTPATMKLIQEFQQISQKNDNDLIFEGFSESQIEDKFRRFFRRTLKVDIQSHDFRTTKINQLSATEGMDIKTVQHYVGHKNPGTTLGYMKLDKEKALNSVKAITVEKNKDEELKKEITLQEFRAEISSTPKQQVVETAKKKREIKANLKHFQFKNSKNLHKIERKSPKMKAVKGLTIGNLRAAIESTQDFNGQSQRVARRQ